MRVGDTYIVEQNDGPRTRRQQERREHRSVALACPTTWREWVRLVWWMRPTRPFWVQSGRQVYLVRPLPPGPSHPPH